MLFVDLGLALRVAGEVLGRDLLLRRPLLVKLAAHLKHARYLRAIHIYYVGGGDKTLYCPTQKCTKEPPRVPWCTTVCTQVLGWSRSGSLCGSLGSRYVVATDLQCGRPNL